ncbi:MAG: universal stress protein [Acidobacteriota bacterium]
MLPFKKILAPTDFSQSSLKAVERAAELAAHFASELCLVHVHAPVPAMPPDLNYGFELPVYDDGALSRAEERLREVVEKSLSPDLMVRTFVQYGDPAREITRIAEEERLDLIVIATHGLTGWRHLVFGSVAEKVLRSAPCPVLTLRFPETEE